MAAKSSWASPHQVGIRVKSLRAARLLINPSLNNLGRAYVEGHLDVEGRIADRVTIAEVLARDAQSRPARGRMPTWLSRHTRQGDRAAIAYHYDVSNAFYQHWLDPEMVYSRAYFETHDSDLATAQIAKLNPVCRKLRLEHG